MVPAVSMENGQFLGLHSERGSYVGRDEVIKEYEDLVDEGRFEK